MAVEAVKMNYSPTQALSVIPPSPRVMLDVNTIPASVPLNLAIQSTGDARYLLASSVSSYMLTLLDDANATAAWATLGGTQSLGVNGYVKLPNGFIIQWGNSSQAISDYNQGLTITFPTLCRAVSCIVDFGTMPATTFVGVLTSNLSQTGFDIRKRVMLNGGTVAAEASPFNIKWMAIGY